MDTDINFFTDAATLAIFDPEVLSHRLDDDFDWWCEQFIDLDEVKNGDISLINLGGDGIYKAKIIDNEISGEEREFAKMVLGPMGLRVTSGQIFVGKGECLPGEDNPLDINRIDDGEGKIVSLDNGLYDLYIYLIEWFDSPKYWNAEYKAPPDAPADYVIKIDKRSGEFKTLDFEPRLICDDDNFLFESETRVIGPEVGMELETVVWKCNDGLTLKECGPMDYTPRLNDYSNVKWNDRVKIRVTEVDHDNMEMLCELL